MTQTRKGCDTECSLQGNPIAILMINYRRAEDTLESVASLMESRNVSITLYLLDNGQIDRSLKEGLNASFGDIETIKLYESAENLGFAQGCNFLAQKALEEGASYLFLLNNDTVIDPLCIEALYRASAHIGDDVAFGGVIGYYDDYSLGVDKARVWHAGALFKRKGFSYQRLGQEQSLGSVKRGFGCDDIQRDRGHEFIEEGRSAPVTSEREIRRYPWIEVDMIIGCALWIPATLVKHYGLFDERFFLNYEETDLCMRLQSQGIKLMTVTDAYIWHKISRSFKSHAHSEFYLSRNKLLWIEKHFGISGVLQYLLSQLPRLTERLLRLMLQGVALVVLTWIIYLQKALCRFKDDMWPRLRAAFIPELSKPHTQAASVLLSSSIFRCKQYREKLKSKISLSIAHFLGILLYFLRRFGQAPNSFQRALF